MSSRESLLKRAQVTFATGALIAIYPLYAIAQLKKKFAFNKRNNFLGKWNIFFTEEKFVFSVFSKFTCEPRSSIDNCSDADLPSPSVRRRREICLSRDLLRREPDGECTRVLRTGKILNYEICN